MYKEALVVVQDSMRPIPMWQECWFIRLAIRGGGTDEAIAKICINDGYHYGCMVEGEKVPCCCCHDLRTQLERMRGAEPNG